MYEHFFGNPVAPLPAHPAGVVGRITRMLRQQWQELVAQTVGSEMQVNVPSSIKSAAEVRVGMNEGISAVSAVEPQTVTRTIVVACSGGADSLCLALGLRDLLQRQGWQLAIAHIDHGWRAESATQAANLRDWLRQSGFSQVGVTRLASAAAGNLEATARNARYQALFDYASQFGELGRQVWIALGHTQDDQAESVLLGLARGAGTGSIQGMPLLTKTGLWRPLLGATRAETEAFCHQLELAPIVDPSNFLDQGYTAADGAPFRRAALRHRGLPALNRALGMDIKPALARCASRFQADHQALQFWAERELQAATVPEATSRIPIPHPILLALRLDQLRALPSAVRTRVWRLAISALPEVAQGDLKSSQILAIDRLITERRQRGPISINHGVGAYRWTGVLYPESGAGKTKPQAAGAGKAALKDELPPRPTDFLIFQQLPAPTKSLM